MKPKTYFLSILLLILHSIAYSQEQIPGNNRNRHPVPEVLREKLNTFSVSGLTEEGMRLFEIANEQINDYQTLFTDHLKLRRHLDRVVYSNRMTEMELRNVVFKPNTKGAETIWWPYFFWLNVLALSGLYFIVLYKKKSKVTSVKVKKKNGTNVKVGDFRLTGREIDVLTLMCKFKSNPEISKILFISMNTTKTHVSNILGKLEVANRKEAIHKVRRLNLLEKSETTKRDKTVKGSGSVLSVFILGFFFMFCQSGLAQLNLENQTECSFLVKLNLVEEGNCRPNGTGGLIVLESGEQVTLPPLPDSAWVISYGIEEVQENPVPVMIGKKTCGFKTVVKNFGSCKATIKYFESGLIIEG